jgi:hypothetical protein
MGHISHRGHFDAPPELVFARGTEPEFMPQYWPKMVRIWDVVGRPDEVGSSFRFRERLLGRYHEVPRGLLFAIADRLVLRRAFENALTHGGEKFKALVEAEAAALPHA